MLSSFVGQINEIQARRLGTKSIVKVVEVVSGFFHCCQLTKSLKQDCRLNLSAKMADSMSRPLLSHSHRMAGQ